MSATSKTFPALTVDLGSPERLARTAHRIAPRDVTAGGMTLTVGAQILEPSTLDSYARRKLITAREYEAGERIGRFFRAAVRPPRVTQLWGERTSQGARRDLVEDVERRRRLWAEMIAAGLAAAAESMPLRIDCRNRTVTEEPRAPIRMTEIGHIVISVCGYDERAGGTRRIAKLRKGLGALADLWKLPHADGPEHEGRIRRSQTADARPSSDALGTDPSAWAAEKNQRRKTKLAERRRRRALGIEDEEERVDVETADEIGCDCETEIAGSERGAHGDGD